MIVDEAVYLEHWGVKGMKWGIRKDRSSSGNSKGKKTSFRERRQAKKQERFAATQKKANGFVKEALKDPDVLILLNRKTVVTGREFVQHLSNGGLLDVNGTRIYAKQKKKGGQYVLQ